MGIVCLAKTIASTRCQTGGQDFGSASFSRKIQIFSEIDFNERRDLHYLFDGSHSPQEICQMLSVLFRVPILTGETLLFFDEIQACPSAINSLRYFYEKLPNLHLIAAGSLLEFALETLPSYGVGRVRSVFMYPFSSYDDILVYPLYAIKNIYALSSLKVGS